MKIFPKNAESAIRAVDADAKRRIINKEADGVLFERSLRLSLKSATRVDFTGGRVAEWQTLGI